MAHVFDVAAYILARQPMGVTKLQRIVYLCGDVVDQEPEWLDSGPNYIALKECGFPGFQMRASHIPGPRRELSAEEKSEVDKALFWYGECNAQELYDIVVGRDDGEAVGMVTVDQLSKYIDVQVERAVRNLVLVPVGLCILCSLLAIAIAVTNSP